jgi:spartin
VGDTSLAAITLLGPIQWPMARDIILVKLDPCHYSGSLTLPTSPDDPALDRLHCGVTLSHPDPHLDGVLMTDWSFLSSPVCKYYMVHFT